MNNIGQACFEYADFSILFRDYQNLLNQAPHLLTEFFKDKCLRGWEIRVNEDNQLMLYDKVDTENNFCESKAILANKNFFEMENRKISEDLSQHSTSGCSFEPQNRGIPEAIEYMLEQYECHDHFQQDNPYKIVNPSYKKNKFEVIKSDDSSIIKSGLFLIGGASAAKAIHVATRIFYGDVRNRNIKELSFYVVTSLVSFGLANY